MTDHPPYPAQPHEQPIDSGKGFFAALFDFSFTHFVTPKIVKIVYVLATIGLALGFLFFLVTAVASGQPAFALFVLLVGPVIAIIYLAFIRMTLEFYLALVRMSEDIHRQWTA